MINKWLVVLTLLLVAVGLQISETNASGKIAFLF